MALYEKNYTRNIHMYIERVRQIGICNCLIILIVRNSFIHEYNNFIIQPKTNNYNYLLININFHIFFLIINITDKRIILYTYILLHMIHNI